MDIMKNLGSKFLICDLNWFDFLQARHYSPSLPLDFNQPETLYQWTSIVTQQAAWGVDVFTLPVLPEPASHPVSLNKFENDLATAVRLLKETAPSKALNVLLPCGEVAAEPWGATSFAAAQATFREILDRIARQGVDIVTLTGWRDLQELRACLVAAHTLERELAVWVQWDDPLAVDVPAFPAQLVVIDSLPAAALCYTGDYSQCRAFLSRARQFTHMPIIVRLTNVEQARLATQVNELRKSGLNGAGIARSGDLSLVKALAEAAQSIPPQPPLKTLPLYITSSQRVCAIGDRLPLVKIGERINPTGRRKLAEQLRRGELDVVSTDAQAQVAAGADALDVNVGAPLVDELRMMVQALGVLQSQVDVPLVIDSASAEVIEAGLQVYAGKALVNSVNAKERRLAEILPLVKKYGAAVIALCIGETIPKTAEERLAFARQILSACEDYQIDRRNIIIDPAALAVATDEHSGPAVLKAIYLIKDQLGLPVSIGASNTSFGLPQRELVHNVFIVQAMAMGLDAAILNPLNPEVHDLIAAASLFCGRDPYCRRYLQHYRQKQQP